MRSVREVPNRGLAVFGPKDSQINASRLKFNISVKTERSRLTSILSHCIFSKNDNNIMRIKTLYFALPVLRARRLIMPAGIAGNPDRLRTNQNARSIFAL